MASDCAERQAAVMQGVRLSQPAESVDGLSAKQAEVVNVMLELGREASIVELSQKFNLSAGAISALRKKGVLEPVKIVTRRGPGFSSVRS